MADNKDGKFCAVRNKDGTPCTCDLDVQMNGGCVFYKPVQPEIVLVEHEGVISDTITAKINGKLDALENRPGIWLWLKEMLDNGAKITCEKHFWNDGKSELDIKTFDWKSSASYEYRFGKNGVLVREAGNVEPKHFPKPKYCRCNAGHQLVEVFDEKRNRFDWDCSSNTIITEIIGGE